MFIDPYLATVTVFAGNFAPLNWAFCNGGLMSIAQYTALFALIGTTYGGDGQTTFALPDLRGRYAIHQGQGPGLPAYFLGEMSGTENTTLLSINLPAHNHVLTSVTGTPGVSANDGTTNTPAGNVPAAGAAGRYTTNTGDASLGVTTAMTSTVPAGGSQPVSNLSPYLAMNYIICVEGIFPSRN
jgi:microcystin-dependent protein